MSFYNNFIANCVQLISFPLELIGLTLAVIDIYFPGKAEEIENFIDKLESGLYRKGSHLKEKSKDYAFWFAVFMAFNFLVNYLYDFDGLNVLVELALHLVSLLIPLCLFVLFSIIIYAKIVIPYLHRSVTFLNKLTSGKALAAIGLILAGLGFLGEFYQVATMLFGE